MAELTDDERHWYNMAQKFLDGRVPSTGLVAALLNIIDRLKQTK